MLNARLEAWGVRPRVRLAPTRQVTDLGDHAATQEVELMPGIAHARQLSCVE